MNEKINPFNPTFGDVPKIYLDDGMRVKKLTDKIQQSEFARSFFITGVRGSGKTSFITKVEKELIKNDNFYSIDLINNDFLLINFINELAELSKTKVQDLFSKLSIKSIDFKNLTLTLDQENNINQFNLIKVAKEAMDKIKEQNKSVVVIIDEVDNNKHIREFAKIFNELKRKEYPIFVIMAGLPDVILDLQNENNLTFLLRSEKEEITPLSNTSMTLAYQKIFNCEFDLAQKMVKMTKGYSYAFQILGSLAFDEMSRTNYTFSIEQLNNITNIYKQFLFENVYNKIFSDLSEVDKKYLICANDKKLSEIAEILKVNSTYAAQYRRRTIEKQLVKPSSFGYVVYTLPYFDEFIKNTQDPDSIYFYNVKF